MTSTSLIEDPKLSLPELAEKRRELRLSLETPATEVELARYVTVVLASFKCPSTVTRPKEYMREQRRRLARRGYPADVIRAAFEEALDSEEWLPSTARMIELCEKHMDLRWDQITALQEEEERRIGVETKKRKREEDQQKTIANVKKHFGEVSDEEVIAAWEAIEEIVGGLDDWRCDLARGKTWAFDALKEMAKVRGEMDDWDEDEDDGSVESPREQAYIRYHDLRHGRT
jgi:hypothetical protein